jgi:anhydro-N-acetylmuramic acid kinase
MTQAPWYIGLMSGTSLDAIDAVLVRFTPSFQLCAHHSEPLPAALRQRILQLTQPGDDEIERLGRLDTALGAVFAEAALTLLRQTGLEAGAVAAIGSHGQTIRHRPEAGFSLQIGDPNTIAERTGITTVADFRRRDLAAGGQGAPLVPAFHAALFRTTAADRVIANLGGMANITVLPADPMGPVLGYDTGPANVLLDGWNEQNRRGRYDEGGAWAATGRVDTRLLDTLLAHPFFQAKPPKSTGRETFNPNWLNGVLARLRPRPAPEDVQATLLELTAITLCDAIRRHRLPSPELYLCGGGCHNDRLRQRIQARLPDHRIDSTAALGLAPDWVEASAFAWLAMRTLQQQSANLPEVTGAKGPRILGTICPA